MITLRDIHKTFPARSGNAATLALRGVDLAIDTDEFVSIVGPSGCGKTTLLRMIAGLVLPDAGAVEIDGLPVSGPGPDRAVVFQQFALLPWATVADNIAFGLELRGMERAERLAIANGLIHAMGLRGFERHFPRQLSGGMQQRVGLARALAVNPAILLMDEPFASVDAQTRRTLQEDLLRLAEKSRKTIVFVTHDIDEAVRLADRVVLMSPRPGQILESLPVALPRPRPDDLDQNPAAIELKAYLWRQLRRMQPAPAPALLP
jgi:ABC-type nitrate/sulfonate/bicarbonate transport system ATPase subunit